LRIQLCLFEASRGIVYVSLVVKNRAAAYRTMAARRMRDTVDIPFSAVEVQVETPAAPGGLAVGLVIGRGLFRFIHPIFYSGRAGSAREKRRERTMAPQEG
jgi:hypothetical protein